MSSTKTLQTSPSILALIVGTPVPADRLPLAARAVLERLTLEEWAAAANLYTEAKERAQREAVSAVPPAQAARAGQAFDRLLRDRHDRDPEARAVIDHALSPAPKTTL